MADILTYRKTRIGRSQSTNKHTVVEVASQNARRRELLVFDALPAWHQDNIFILSHYRPISGSFKDCIHSWTYAHNELINIHTHLLPSIGFLVFHLILQIYIQDLLPDVSVSDRVVLGINTLAATVTLTLSALYHTCMSHSESVAGLLLRVDYVGILVLILGSFFSGIYIGFQCHPYYRYVYWSMIIGLSTITAFLVLHPRLQGIYFRPHRTTAFIATALSGLAPIAHGLCLYGFDEMWVRSGMPYYLLEGVFYGIGAFLFANHFPESKWPGKFDLIGSSHQIFHVLVVCGAIVHVHGILQSMQWNYNNPSACLA